MFTEDDYRQSSRSGIPWWSWKRRPGSGGDSFGTVCPEKYGRKSFPNTAERIAAFSAHGKMFMVVPPIHEAAGCTSRYRIQRRQCRTQWWIPESAVPAAGPFPDRILSGYMDSWIKEDYDSIFRRKQLKKQKPCFPPCSCKHALTQNSGSRCRNNLLLKPEFFVNFFLFGTS